MVSIDMRRVHDYNKESEGHAQAGDNCACHSNNVSKLKDMRLANLALCMPQCLVILMEM